MEQILKQIKDASVVVGAAYKSDIQHPSGWCALIGQEVGKVQQSLLEDDLQSEKGMIRHRSELVKVAAASVAAIECLDRKSNALTAKDPAQLEIQFPD